MTEDHVTDENTPRAMISLERLLELVPVSQTTLARMERRGTFPSGRIIGQRKLWFADEVAAWQTALHRDPRPSARVRRGVLAT